VNGHPVALLQRVITVRTPENIELRYALAGAGSRAAAYFVDLLVMFFVGQLLLNLIVYGLAALTAAFSGGSQQWAAAVAGLLGFALYNGYFILFEWLLNGQTPGKRLLHVRVVKEGGYALRLFDTLVRNLLRVVDFIPAFYGVGLASLLLTRHSQRLGDLAAGTLVVHQEAVETASLLPDLPEPRPTDVPLAAEHVAAVPAEVVALAGQFLARRGELAPRPRQEIGAELADLVRRASGLAPQPAQSTENFLAVVLRQGEQIATSAARAPGPA
jgi:uncharacterized RDD family membrane protein YckC